MIPCFVLRGRSLLEPVEALSRVYGASPTDIFRVSYGGFVAAESV